MKEISKQTCKPLCKILVFITVLLTFFIRPFALGLWFSFIGYVLLFFVAVIVFCTTKHDNFKATNKYMFVMLLVYFVEFLLFQTAQGYKSFFTLTGQVVIVYILFSNKNVMSLFFKYFKQIVLLLCILGISNFLLECYVDVEKLVFFTLDSHENGFLYIYSLSYPLSISYMLWYIPESTIPLLNIFEGQHVRQNYFFIEPGIAAIFIVLMIHYILTIPNEKNKKLKISILIVSLFLTFSTTGPIILILSFFFRYLAINRNHLSYKTVIVSVFLAIAAYYAYLYMPIFGKIDKMNFGNASQSIEEHSNVAEFVLGGTILLLLIGTYIVRFKRNTAFYLMVIGVLCVGYLSNHVAYTNLATMFIFYDNNYEKYYSRRLLKFI